MTLRGLRGGLDGAEALTPSSDTPSPSSKDPDELPKLDKYDVQEEIGHGGMATVYRALDPALGREVAVKVIHRHLRDNVEVAQRFVAEARASAKLKHRGIVEVYDVSRDEDRERYLVAELIRGCTLRKVLLEHRDMPPEIGAAIVAELCDAVEHAHEAGLIHRDIKPENVLVERPQDRARGPAITPTSIKPPRSSGSGSAHRRVREGDTPPPSRDDDDEFASSAPRVVSRAMTSDDGGDGRSGRRSGAESAAPSSTDPGSGRTSERPESSAPTSRSSGPEGKPPRSAKPGGRVVIKLTDFGIAKVLDAQSVTSTGQVLGSPAHMAPEQIEGGEVDARTDVFALGVLLYECLVGHLPFEGKNPAQVLRRVIEGSFAPADAERPIVGNRFASIVAAALATDPNDRPRSAAELGAELRKELGELGIDAPGDEVSAYFADPSDAYADALAERVVPRLIARGEAARKARNVPLAAGDFNRAHALSPRDPTILKRITQLSSARGRRILVRRLSIIGLGAVVLGGAAFGIARFVRQQNAELASSPSQSREGNTSDVRISPITPDDPSSVIPVPRLSAPVSAVLQRPIGPIRLPPSAEPDAALFLDGPRLVHFATNPPGARLVVDGVPRAFNSEDQLTPGPHAYTVSPAGPDDCCEAVSSSLTVPKARKDKPSEAFKFAVSLKFRPAHVSISGIPAGGTATCNGVPVGAAPVDIPANSADKIAVACTFTSEKGTGHGGGKVNAGGSASFPWRWPDDVKP
ncbi:MAG: protein kinase [Polyangiaceae bacterium]